MKKIIITITAIMMTAVLAACGSNTSAADAPDPAADTAAESAQESPQDEEVPAVLVTEEDYRNALASESDNAKKLELYREFSSGYKMNTEEYAEFAALCEEAGDTVSQRSALFALYRLDPTEEHGQMMSDMTLKITPEDDDKAEGLLTGLLDQLAGFEADDFSPEAVKSIITSEDWKKSFYIDNGTFTSHTEFTGDGISATVDSDTLATRAVITSDDKRYLCDVSYNWVDVGCVEVKDGQSDGKYVYRQFDGDNVDIMSVNGYISNGHYVNQLDIRIGDVSYSGSFDDEGKTKEEQPEGFDGVAYAYTDGGENYLYVENADAATFVANIGDMGFEEF